MKYYVDSTGAYLGGWDDNPPTGAIEVPDAPQDARQVWAMPDGPWGPVPVSPYTLPVAIFWLRMSDEEAEDFDGAMSTATPLRLRKAFNTASTMISDGELFGFVRNILASATSPSRAEQVMAEPTGATSSLAETSLT